MRPIHLILSLLVAIVLLLRHDYWPANWDSARPLLFGFLPVGLWWQALVTLLASVMMWLLVRFAWPRHLEDEAIEAERHRQSHSGEPTP